MNDGEKQLVQGSKEKQFSSKVMFEKRWRSLATDFARVQFGILKSVK